MGCTWDWENSWETSGKPGRFSCFHGKDSSIWGVCLCWEETGMLQHGAASASCEMPFPWVCCPQQEDVGFLILLLTLLIQPSLTLSFCPFPSYRGFHAPELLTADNTVLQHKYIYIVYVNILRWRKWKLILSLELFEEWNSLSYVLFSVFLVMVTEIKSLKIFFYFHNLDRFSQSRTWQNPTLLYHSLRDFFPYLVLSQQKNLYFNSVENMLGRTTNFFIRELSITFLLKETDNACWLKN